jgi:Xaa-Pro aminopeptidase
VDHQLRRRALGARLEDLQVDALYVTRRPNVRYLTGFTGSAGQVLVAADASVFSTDGRYTEQSRHEVPDIERETYGGGVKASQLLAAHCERLGIERLGFQADELTVAAHGRLSEALDGVEMVGVDDLVGELRWIKDDEELHLLRRAQAATDDAFERILEALAVGVTERQIALELEHAMRRDGSDGLAFDSIVAFGESAAEPHHEPGHRALEEGDVIKLDFGAKVGGYHADMTRTVAFGEPAAELRKIHDIVRQSQQAGIDAVRAGVSGGEVDAVARAVIADAGYGERFTHGLGHGVGLEVHEGPSVGHEIDDVLPVGAVVTVEPGIYVPGLGGVRIEDMVEVTDDGCRVIGTASRELIEL